VTKKLATAKFACNKSRMSIVERAGERKFGRKVVGMAACLLPYEEDGRIARGAFEEAVGRTGAAGLECAVNMDTGYANYLSGEERRGVLGWTRGALGGGSFVGGVFVEGLEGDLVDLYRRGMDEVVEFGGTPILFQTTRFHGWEAQRIVDLYAQVCDGYAAVYGFELGRMFAPNGMIFSEETVRGLIGISALKGMKHSSLDRGAELARLALRDELRPEFKIFTGNDLGIDMIEYGSDYLLGLAAFCPEKFAERDGYWEAGDERYFALADALQYLGNVAFRAPVPAYKHSCAVFQHLLGRIPSPAAHPQCPRRPDWERGILEDCAARLGYAVA
jgi:4-hydroxy-tetrahydrodipicolinate synthase